MARYKLVRCPKCKHWQIMYGEKVFKCRWCRYQCSLEHVRIWFESDDFDKVHTMLLLYAHGKLKPWP